MNMKNNTVSNKKSIILLKIILFYNIIFNKIDIIEKINSINLL